MRGSDDTILLVGGGAAAFSFVSTYRDAGGTRPVVLVSDDDRLPYFRPAVSKEYLVGATERADMSLEDPAWYRSHDVDVMLGCSVTALDLAARLAVTSQEPIRWERCVVATGSAARTLPVPGGDDARNLTVRSAADVERLHAQLAVMSGPVVVIGSGFVGCEVASGLAEQGVEVTIVSDEDRPHEGRLGAPVGELITGWLRDAGVQLVLGASVGAVRHHAGSVVVDVTGRPSVDAAHVIMAVGARPRTELLASVGLLEDDAVPVDGVMATAVDGLDAIGDIAAAWNERAGRRLRVEHWGDAQGHGRTLGDRVAGGRAPWADVPGFWSTIAGQTLKYVAWGDGHGAIEVEQSSAGTTVWYGRDGVVVGVLTHGHDEDNERAAAAVGGRWPFPP